MRSLQLLLVVALLVAHTCAAPQKKISLASGGGEAKGSMSGSAGTNSKTFKTGGGKTTIIANKNTLTQDQLAPKKTDPRVLQEMDMKSRREEGSKKQQESSIKTKQEQLQKKEAAESTRREQLREQARKKEQKEAGQKAHAKAQEAQQKRTDAAAEAERKRRLRMEKGQKTVAEAKQKKAAEEQAKKAGDFKIHSGFANYGHGWDQAHVHKFGDVCMLGGLLRGHNGLVGHVPSECRPTQGRLIFSMMKGNVPARVDVLPDGRVYTVTAGGNHWVSLNGITYTTRMHDTLQLQHRWRNYDHGYRRATAAKVEGLCVVSGLIRHGAWHAPLTRVPSDCVPRDRLIFSVDIHERVARLDLLSNALLYHITNPSRHHWIALDGTVYTPQTGNSLSLYNGWANYHHTYRVASYVKTGDYCAVSGLIKPTRGWHGHITTLPSGCRPQGRIIFGCNVHGYSARVDVLPNGQVHYVANGRHGWMSLSNIVFSVN